MDEREGRKRGNLALVPVERTAREWMDLEFAESVAALEVAAGKKRPRRFYKIAEGERHPLRVLARLIDDALEARVPVELVIGAVTRVLRRYAARKRRLPVPHTGEFHPPFAA